VDPPVIVPVVDVCTRAAYITYYECINENGSIEEDCSGHLACTLQTASEHHRPSSLAYMENPSDRDSAQRKKEVELLRFNSVLRTSQQSTGTKGTSFYGAFCELCKK
jgi:hypothetical protein